MTAVTCPEKALKLNSFSASKEPYRTETLLASSAARRSPVEPVAVAGVSVLGTVCHKGNSTSVRFSSLCKHQVNLAIGIAATDALDLTLGGSGSRRPYRAVSGIHELEGPPVGAVHYLDRTFYSREHLACQSKHASSWNIARCFIVEASFGTRAKHPACEGLWTRRRAVLGLRPGGSRSTSWYPRTSRGRLTPSTARSTPLTQKESAERR